MTPRPHSFDDGTDARSDFRSRSGGGRHGQRKTMQLCTQVRRAIELTLVGDCQDEALQDLMVEAVEPAPDDSRLRIVVQPYGAAAEIDRTELLSRLEAARGLLVREVAQAIHRRKTPELAFDLRPTAAR